MINNINFKLMFWCKYNSHCLTYFTQFDSSESILHWVEQIRTSVPGPSGGNQVDGLPPDVHTGAGKIGFSRVQRLLIKFAKNMWIFDILWTIYQFLALYKLTKLFWSGAKHFPFTAKIDVLTWPESHNVFW